MITNLKATTQKSYYGKAKVIDCGTTVSLKSYDTIVCLMDCGEFVKTWNGYSRTTMCHINDFRRLYGLPALSKKEWEKIPCASGNSEKYRVEFSNGFHNWKAAVVFDSYDDADAFGCKVADSRNWNIYYDVVNA